MSVGRGFEARLVRKSSQGVYSALVICAVQTTGCATPGATYGSGVGDAIFDHPPYYAGGWKGDGRLIGHLPVAYQAGASDDVIFDPSPAGPMRELVTDLNNALNVVGWTVGLVENGGESAPHDGARTPPDVRFGCRGELGIDEMECFANPESARGRGRQEMELSIGRPSRSWTESTLGLMSNRDVPFVVIVTVEVGQFPLRQVGFRGRKVVELGTRHSSELPWLTSLETSVRVLQLTGAVVGRDGKAVRIGAEGMMALRTRLAVSSIGGQELIDDADVVRLRSARREDLPGRPLVWEQALRDLLSGLSLSPPVRVSGDGG